MNFYYKQSDNLERIRARIRKFKLIRRISIIAFIIFTALGLIDFVLIRSGAAQVTFLTMFLVIFWLLSALIAFGAKGGNETKNIIKNLEIIEQELIQKGKLGNFIQELESPPLNNKGLSFFGNWPIPLKIVVSLILLLIVGGLTLYAIRTNQLHLFIGKRMPIVWIGVVLLMIPVISMWFPRNYKALSPAKRVIYIILLWVVIMIAILFAFLLVVVSMKNMTS